MEKIFCDICKEEIEKEDDIAVFVDGKKMNICKRCWDIISEVIQKIKIK